MRFADANLDPGNAVTTMNFLATPHMHRIPAEERKREMVI